MTDFPPVIGEISYTSTSQTWFAFSSNDVDPNELNSFSHSPDSKSKWIGIAVNKNKKQASLRLDKPTNYLWVPLGDKSFSVVSRLNSLENLIKNIQITGGNVDQAKIAILNNEVQENIRLITELTKVVDERTRINAEAINTVDASIISALEYVQQKFANYDDALAKISNSTGVAPNISSIELDKIRKDIEDIGKELLDKDNSISNLQINHHKQLQSHNLLERRVIELEKRPTGSSVSDQRINEISARSIVNENNIKDNKALLERLLEDTDEALAKIDEIETDTTEAKRDIEDRINPKLISIEKDLMKMEVNYSDALRGIVPQVQSNSQKIAYNITSINEHSVKIQTIEADNQKLNDLIANLKVNGGNLSQTEIDIINVQIKALGEKLSNAVNELKQDKFDDTEINVKLTNFKAEIDKVTKESRHVRDIVDNIGRVVASFQDIIRQQISTAETRLNKISEDIKHKYDKYLHIVYSSEPSGIDSQGQSQLVNTKSRYMGLNLSNEVDAPTEATSYQWIDLGTDFVQKFRDIYLKYSKYATGRDSSHNISFLDDKSNPAERIYVGLAISDVEPTLPEDYTWSRLRGIDGVDGKSSDQKLFIKYSQYANGKDDAGNTVYSASKKTREYIGFAIATKEPVNADGYDWSQFKGDMPSHVKPLYFHFMFARGKNGEDMSPLPEDRKWVGFVNNWESENAPKDFKQYRWMKLEGEKGEQGIQGLSGKDGKDGKNGKDGYAQYIFMRFSPYATGETPSGIPSFTTRPNKDTRYIGWSFNNQSHIAPIEADDYFWYEIAIGTAKTGFTHIKYSDDMLSLHNDSTNKKFVGFSFGTDSPVNAPTDVTQYQWFELGQGVRGEKGKAGASTYTHIVYSRYTDGFDLDRNSSYSENPDNETAYVGFRAGQKTEMPDLTNPLLYKWVKIRGDLGLSLRTYFGFSDFKDGVDSQGVFAISQTYTGQRYMMISYNSVSLSPPTRPDAYLLKIDLGKLSGKASGFTQSEIEGFCANISANMLGQAERKITTLETKVNSNTSDIARFQATVNIIKDDVLQLKKVKPTVDLEPLETRVTNVEADITILKATTTLSDLTNITNTINKFTTDVTNFTAQVSNNTARLATLGLSDTNNGKAIKDNASNITKLEDADKAINIRIDGLDTQVKAVNTRVDNLVLNSGDVNTAEIQTVKDSVTQLRADHKKELDRLQNKKASYNLVDQIQVQVQEFRGEMGVIRTSNQEVTDRMNVLEQAHGRYVVKSFVTGLTDPLIKDVTQLKTDIIDVKQISSDVSNVNVLAKKNKSRLDVLEPKVDGLDSKLQTLSDDVSKIQTTKGVTAQELLDINTALSSRINAIDLSIEAKVNSFVDKKLKSLPTDSVPVLQSEVAQLKQQVNDLLTKLSSIETSKVELKYSPTPDNNDLSDSKQTDSNYVGVKIVNTKLI